MLFKKVNNCVAKDSFCNDWWIELFFWHMSLSLITFQRQVVVYISLKKKRLEIHSMSNAFNFYYLKICPCNPSTLCSVVLAYLFVNRPKQQQKNTLFLG